MCAESLHHAADVSLIFLQWTVLRVPAEHCVIGPEEDGGHAVLVRVAGRQQAGAQEVKSPARVVATEATHHHVSMAVEPVCKQDHR